MPQTNTGFFRRSITAAPTIHYAPRQAPLINLPKVALYKYIYVMLVTIAYINVAINTPTNIMESCANT